MMAVETFFKEHYKIMLIGLAGVLLGVVIHVGIRMWDDRKFLGRLNGELGQLEARLRNGGLDADEQKLLDKLKAEILIMRLKCNV